MDWYDRAETYDRLFGWDPAVERDFVLAASARHGIEGPRRILEPFCGSGRLLRAMPGTAIGFDLNPNMVRYAAARGLKVFRADAGRFAVAPGTFDLAYCLIDSFRHLLRVSEAAGHLRSVARALRPGAVYVLGLDLMPGDESFEIWEHDGVRALVRCLGDVDPDTRIGTLHFRMECGDETIESFSPMLTYTPRQLEDLIDGEASFEIAAVFDLAYDLENPVELDEIEGSAVLVLRRDDG